MTLALALALALVARVAVARALAVGPRSTAPRLAASSAPEPEPRAAVVDAPRPTVAELPAAAFRRPSRAVRASPQRSATPSTERWVELRPRMSERPDGTLRLDLRGVSDLAPFSRGFRARAAPSGGFEVSSLDAQGYLASAGVSAGDRLVALNGRPTRTLDELLTAYAMARLGSTLSLQFARGAGHYGVRAEVLRDGP